MALLQSEGVRSASEEVPARWRCMRPRLREILAYASKPSMVRERVTVHA